MSIHKSFKLGNTYSKKDLAILLDNPNIAGVREGIYHHSDKDTLIFVDLNKDAKEERFHLEDYYDGEYFHWDSQTTQHIDSPKIQDIVNGIRIPYLFAREFRKINGKTQPFIYCGRLQYIEYEKGTSKPVHIVYQSIDYDDFTENEALMDIYLWRPEKVGKPSTASIIKRNVVSEQRRRKYVKPNKTERKGFITSRVGQGYYRQQILDYWNARCPITKCDIKEILVSSHIVPWSECSDKERLDVNNGILLSPNMDALFDQHLISFTSNGNILISNRISLTNRKALGIDDTIQIDFNNDQYAFLERHRKQFYIMTRS